MQWHGQESENMVQIVVISVKTLLVITKVFAKKDVPKSQVVNL